MGFIDAGEQVAHADAVVSLYDDAGQVGDQRVGNDDAIAPPWIPEEKQRNKQKCGKMAQLAAPGFSNESLQVCRIGGSHLTFCESPANPSRTIGQQAFPLLDEKQILVTRCGFRRRRGRRVEPANRHAREHPRQSHLNDGPKHDIEDHDPDHWKFNRH